LNALLDRSFDGSEFTDHDLERIFPFIEQMGSGQRAADSAGYRKEFWWEREWRCVADFTLPRHVIGLCPEADFDEFRRVVGQNGRSATFIDPSWGLEEIIAGLAGFTRDEVVTL
jgi:hypothetical protein